MNDPTSAQVLIALMAYDKFFNDGKYINTGAEYWAIAVAGRAAIAEATKAGIPKASEQVDGYGRVDGGPPEYPVARPDEFGKVGDIDSDIAALTHGWPNTGTRIVAQIKRLRDKRADAGRDLADLAERVGEFEDAAQQHVTDRSPFAGETCSFSYWLGKTAAFGDVAELLAYEGAK